MILWTERSGFGEVPGLGVWHEQDPHQMTLLGQVLFTTTDKKQNG
jgi:hypothetical protein